MRSVSQHSKCCQKAESIAITNANRLLTYTAFHITHIHFPCAVRLIRTTTIRSKENSLLRSQLTDVWLNVIYFVFLIIVFVVAHFIQCHFTVIIRMHAVFEHFSSSFVAAPAAAAVGNDQHTSLTVSDTAESIRFF